MRIGLVGGASGGHFYPLMAVAVELNNAAEQPRLYYFGPTPYNAESLKTHNVEHVYCPAGKLRRDFSLQNVLDIFRNFFGLFVAIWQLYKIYPDVIFSKGGYTAVPILIAARLLMIPVVIHESDTTPGRANQMAAKFAKYIAVSYDDAAKFFPAEKTALTGIPLRAELKTAIADPFAALGIPHDKPLIYVTGGSQGADRLNQIILRSLTDFLPHYRIFHQVGESNIEQMRQTAKGLLQGTDFADSYYLEGHISANQVSALLKAASIVITRAGSTTLFEIAYHGKPSIVVPIPEDVSRDQRTNAYTYARGGAATVIEELNLTPHLLAQEINTIMTSPEKQTQMAAAAQALFIPDAAQKLAASLISIGTEHGS